MKLCHSLCENLEIARLKFGSLISQVGFFCNEHKSLFLNSSQHTVGTLCIADEVFGVLN